MDESKPKPPEPEMKTKLQAQAKAKVAERDPLSVVVLDAPVAEPDVLPKTSVEVPVRVQPTVFEPGERKKTPMWYWALVGLGAFLMLASFKRFYEPLMVHVEDSIERRVYGEKTIKAPESNPHTPRQKQSWF